MCKDGPEKTARGINPPYIIPFFIPQEGCPHKCIYCDSRASSHGQNSEITPLGFKQRVECFLRTRNDRGSKVEVAFYGGSFNCLSVNRREYLLSLLKPFLFEGTVHSLRVSLRPEPLEIGVLREMVDHKLGTVELGVQSMIDSTLERIGRGHTSKDIYKAFKILRDLGIKISAHIIPGLPGEDEKTFFKSLSDLLALSPDFLRIHPLIVLPGTTLELMYKKREYVPLSLDKAVDICAEAYKMAAAAGITVLRIGLQANEIFDSKAIGPYHPSFGEMVFSRIALDKIRKKIDSLKTRTGYLSIKANPAYKSKIVGNRRSNLEKLKKEYDLRKITISEDPSLGPDVITLSFVQACQRS